MTSDVKTEKLFEAYNINPKKVNKMRNARIKLGLTQRDMARILGTTQATYSRTEARITEASDEMLEKIAAILRLKKRDLYTKPRVD